MAQDGGFAIVKMGYRLGFQGLHVFAPMAVGRAVAIRPVHGVFQAGWQRCHTLHAQSGQRSKGAGWQALGKGQGLVLGAGAGAEYDLCPTGGQALGQCRVFAQVGGKHHHGITRQIGPAGHNIHIQPQLA